MRRPIALSQILIAGREAELRAILAAALLEQWLAEVLQTYGDRVLNLDGDAAQI
jgi:hypothetical protein